MLFNLLSAEQTRSALFEESLLYGALGFAVVFVGIAFLIFVVWLVGLIMAKATQKAKPQNKKMKETSPSIPQTQEDEIDEETLAVITASIMAYYQANKPKCDFVVKRIKRF